MITQGSDTLYTLDELVELLKTNSYRVLGIEEWYLDKTLNQYYEIPGYDFSQIEFSNEEIIDLLTNRKYNTNADMYTIVLDN